MQTPREEEANRRIIYKANNIDVYVTIREKKGFLAFYD